MNTNSYIQPSVIIFKAALMAGDKDFKALPKSFYEALIQQAFEKLALATFFDEKRADIPLNGELIHDLPKDCFNVKNVYVFNGNSCDIASSRKVYWKRNYYTPGTGYIANNKWNNFMDPFYNNNFVGAHRYGEKVTVRLDDNTNNVLYYNFQMGKIMLSSSCLGAGNNLHIHYNGTGCPIDEVPIIPVFLREAMEDYVITQALLVRMANDSGDIRKWQALYNTHEAKLSHPYEGSWARAEYAVKTLNASQREELAEYLGRNAWADGF